MRANVRGGMVLLGAAMTIAAGPASSAAQAVQAPGGLFVSQVTGNTVTLRWDPPLGGPAPDGYVLEGGVTPGSVLASVPTGLSAPIFTFVAPTGSFFVRVHSLLGAARSSPSNEVPLHVNVAVPAASPANLTGLVNGTSLALTWWNNFTDGPPGSLLLDVSGALNATLPLPLVDTFSFAGVPPGTYTFRLRAANAAGVSASSSPVTLTFPGTCSGPPAAPTAFTAYATGNILSGVWGPAVSGPATSSFVVNVTGAFNGSFPTTARTVSGTVPPGTYDLWIVGVNACGTSGPSSARTVTIP